MRKGRGLRTYTIFYLIFLYAPIVLLPLFAFNDSKIIAFPLKGFTTDWFVALWHKTELHQAVLKSLIIAVTTAVFATALGVFAARAGTKYRFRGKGPVLGFIMLPLVLPDIIVAVSLLVVLLRIGMGLGMTAAILGHVVICLPFAIAILNSAFSSLDQSLEEAAYDLGETPFSAFRLVILPLVMPGIISSLLITFTISLDEYIIASFLVGTEETLPVYLFNQMTKNSREIPVVLALGTVLVLFSILLLGIAEYFRRRGIARTGGKDTGGFL
ncbi:ABC transporter permease [Frigidibacter sp. ROC022]|uniref:ABC transporter permease n=1 Tax=Frigidibacter sp. ROC022 TaxID=2971796 RepID=UPI00215B76CC|nr:ABC transporter permease [Frigidibacter sp. ROC022]MCR8726435.1 ABC transporter permease [Frigidibacter sp. ROC022]